jgi:hypothetical protein
MEITTITPDDAFERVHTYFKGSPYHPDGHRLLYTRFADLRDPADICILDTATGEEAVVGRADSVTYHQGATAYFCDGGRRVIYQRSYDWENDDKRHSTVACVDVESGESSEFAGEVGIYYGNIDDRFLEVDADRPAEEQGGMGIYTRKIDGSDRRCLATVDDLLACNPAGSSIRQSRTLLRLGGEISPDGSAVMLYLVTRFGVLVRDYYVCDPDGSNLTFHGRIGLHLMWLPNSREVVGFVNPYHSSYFGQLRGSSSSWGYGLLGCYDTKTRVLRVLSDERMTGGPHLSPSPDGRMVVIDENDADRATILLYDFASGELREAHSQPRVLAPIEGEREAGRARGSAAESARELKHGKRYRVHAHPVFSRDSSRIVFNSCTDGRVRLKEIAL